MTLGDRLKQIRGNVSQVDFAAHLKTSRATLQRYESGSSTPDADFIINFCRKNLVNANWLLTGYGEMMLHPQAKIQVEHSNIIETCYEFREDDPEIVELLEKAQRVLKSGNPVAFDALERNIRYFDHAVAVEKRLDMVEEKLGIALDALAKTQDALNAMAKMKEMKKAAVNE